MRLLFAAAALSLALAPVAGAKELSAQQQRMKNCNAEAKEKSLKGDERKAFMKTCLSGKTGDTKDTNAEAKAEKAPTNPQQSKMKDCNAQAKEKKLKGDERKAFMSSCLKAS
jgi:hypothetical protein